MIETHMLAWMPGTMEWVVIGIVALLLFGRRLPDVARSMGKSIVEFKRGIRDMQDDIDKDSKRLDTAPRSREPLGRADNRTDRADHPVESSPDRASH